MKKFYNYKKQPQFLSGEKSQQEIFEIFLKKFDMAFHEDNKVIKKTFYLIKIIKIIFFFQMENFLKLKF